MSQLPALAPRLIERRLDNGLRVVLFPENSSPLVAVNVWYHVGSKNDPQGRTGLAHLFEHMLFQGSEHVDTNGHFRHVQQVGGSANGSTSFDRTNYYETLPAHCLELGLWLESDRLGFFLSALDHDKFEGQRSVVINERRQRVDNRPYGRSFETLQQELFGDRHPYSWPIIGRFPDLEDITLPDVSAFFSSFYSTSNAVLTLAGDFDTAEAEDLIRAYFGDLPAGPAIEQPSAVAPTQTGARLQFDDDVAMSRVYLAWRTPSFAHPDRAAGELLASLLAVGKSSPLYQDLVHQGQLAQEVSAFMLPLELDSVFMVVATVRPGIEAQRVEDRLLEHLAAAGAGRLGAEDLKRARNQIVAGFFQELESVESLADLLAQFTVLVGDPAAIDAEARRYLRLDCAEAASFASRYLAPEHAVRLLVTPRSEPGD